MRGKRPVLSIKNIWINIRSVNTLLEVGVDANAKSYLVEKRDPQWIRFLLKHGADVNQKMNRGLTTLHQAADAKSRAADFDVEPVKKVNITYSSV